MWDESFSRVCVFISGRLLVRVTSSLKVQIVEGVFLWNLKKQILKHSQDFLPETGFAHCPR